LTSVLLSLTSVLLVCARGTICHHTVNHKQCTVYNCVSGGCTWTELL